MQLHHARFLFTELQRTIGFDAPHDKKNSNKKACNRQNEIKNNDLY